MSQFHPPGRPLVSKQPISSGKATASLVLGLLSFMLTLLAGIPAVILGVLALQEIKRNPNMTGGGLATAGIVTGSIGSALSCLFPILIALLLPAVQAARDAARSTVSSNNLRNIGIAVHNYHDVHRRLPPVSSPYDVAVPQGGPQALMSSWRVRLIPHLDQGSLNAQFDPTQPWDSAANRHLVTEMPPAFQCPAQNELNRAGNTVYQAVVRSANVPEQFQTGMEGHRGAAGFRHCIDGVANTIFFVETNPDRSVPWTQPKDFEFDWENPKRGLGDLRPNSFIALFGDASVRRINMNINDQTLRWLFIRNDGQLIVPP